MYVHIDVFRNLFISKRFLLQLSYYGAAVAMFSLYCVQVVKLDSILTFWHFPGFPRLCHGRLDLWPVLWQLPLHQQDLLLQYRQEQGVLQNLVHSASSSGDHYVLVFINCLGSNSLNCTSANQ